MNERSTRGPVSNVGVVAYSQFEVMDEEDADLLAEFDKASFKTKALYGLMKKARGGAPIWAVQPDLLFSTDDTTTFVFDGKLGKNGKWKVASDTAVKNSGTNALYKTEKISFMNGVRVKITFTYTGAGMTAPLFITVSGLTEEEMPDDEFLHVQVPGLAIGGAGVTIGSTEIGHIFFMRKTKGADEERVKIYQDEVLKPWIERVRKDLDSDFSYDTEVPTKMKAVSWMDGDLAQVATVIDDVAEFAKLGVTVCKQNAGRTGVEQPADLCPVFKLIKKYISDTTSTDNPLTQRFRKKLEKAFKTNEVLSKLKLKPTHKNALLDFLAILSTAATKACSPSNVLKGWTESGLVDEECYRFPSLYRILATCKKVGGLEQSTVDQIVKDFKSLLEEVDAHGRISEEWFDEHNYARDCNSKDEDVLRPDSITREHMQRSKVMTHDHQVELRATNIEEKINLKRSKLVKENEDHEQLVRRNEVVVQKLCKLAGQPTSESNLVNCTLENFASILAPELDTFILAHDEKVKKKSDIPSKKGTLEDAKAKKEFKILRAFNCREKQNQIDRIVPNDLEAFDSEITRPKKRRRTHRTITILDESNKITASRLLSDNEWVKRLEELLDMTTMVENVTVREEDKKNADMLANILRVRMKNQINGRVTEETKRNHPIWDFAERNLPICAAYMILVGHVKSDLPRLREKDSLLAFESNNFIPVTRFPKRHGAYVQKDEKQREIVRSGKKNSHGAVVEGFAKRIAEHEKGCKSENPISNFYKLYPSKSTKRSSMASKRGLYEDLSHGIAAGFDPKGRVAQLVNCSWDEGGVLVLNAQDKQRVSSSMPKRKYTDVEKFQILLSYLFELAYDVAIAPALNVSESPGFESFLMSSA